MFFASLLKIARNWEELRFSSMEEWKKKIWQVYTMENYSVVKKINHKIYMKMGETRKNI